MTVEKTTPLFETWPAQERYELSSGAICDVPYRCSSANLAVVHGTADLAAVSRLLAGQRYRPVSIGGGRCVAALWFADYHDTSCGAYHEFVVTFAASLKPVEVPVATPLELLHAGMHPDATLLVHHLILDQQIPIEYGREVNGFNKYSKPQPVAIEFDEHACRFDIGCEGQSVIKGRLGLPQEAAPVARVSLGFVTGAAVFQARGIFHFDMQTRFRAFDEGDTLTLGNISEAGRELRDIGYSPRLVQFLPQARFVMSKPLNWLSAKTR